MRKNILLGVLCGLIVGVVCGLGGAYLVLPPGVTGGVAGGVSGVVAVYVAMRLQAKDRH
jgi:membrane associated rhomboid family serine protease